MSALVSIEESAIGDKRWAVIITRPDRIMSRTLWERYATQAEAQKGAKAARAYLDNSARAAARERSEHSSPLLTEGDKSRDELYATLQSQARRVEELEGALKVFAAIVPSSLHPADGSEAEAYVIMLHDPKMLGQGGAPDFTGADLARARSALSEGEKRE